MSSIYPTNFSSLNGENCFDQNGELTPVGQVWLHEVEKLTVEQITIGVDNLRFKKNPEFAPSAVEFSAFCLRMSINECADEILKYIERAPSSKFWWKTEAAFNVYKQIGAYDANNRTEENLLQRIEQVYKSLDLDNLDPIPQRPEILPVKEPSKVDRERGKFQAKMFTCIMNFRPDLMGVVKHKDDGSMPEVVQDKSTVELLQPHKSNELMHKWYSQDQPNMVNFLRGEGFAI